MSSLANSLTPGQSLLDSDSERGSPKWALHLPTAGTQPGLLISAGPGRLASGLL